MQALKFGDLLAGWKLATIAKFQLNISKIMPASAKNTGTWVVNTNYSTNIMMQDCPLGLKFAFYSNSLHVVQSAFTSPLEKVRVLLCDWT